MIQLLSKQCEIMLFSVRSLVVVAHFLFVCQYLIIQFVIFAKITNSVAKKTDGGCCNGNKRKAGYFRTGANDV